MQVKLPKLYEWQQVVFDDLRDNLKDFYVVKAKRQIGKSILAIEIMLYYAFKEKSISTCVEPTLSQSRRVFKQIVNACGGEGSKLIKSANATLLSIEFINGSEIIFKSAEQEEALRGMTVKKGILIIDEAAFIKDDIFEILYPIVDANKCPVLLISTPLFLSGEFYKKYMQGKEDGLVKSYDWAKYDTSIFLSKEKLEYYRETMSPLKFRSEILGEFIAEGSYVFGDVMKNAKGYSKRNAVFGGLDWAGGNDGDYTVLTLMDDGGAVTDIISLNNMTPTEQIERLAKEINSRPTLKCVQVEMNSIGRVYHDMLKREVKVSLKQFTTTNDTKREIIENLITAFQTDKVQIPNEPELIRELQHYNMEKTSKGYTYNGADGVHDDMVMSLAFAYDAYKKNNYIFKISFV